METLKTALELTQGIDWRDPKISFILSLLAVFGLFSRWKLVITLVLLIALGRGLKYFLVIEDIAENSIGQICMIFYLLGGIFIFVIAVMQFFFKEK